MRLDVLYLGLPQADRAIVTGPWEAIAGVRAQGLVRSSDTSGNLADLLDIDATLVVCTR